MRKILIISLAAIALGAFLWFYSDKPPYGYVYNELSNNSWGPFVDIANKWRGFDFRLWDRSLWGGCSLFTIGLYPILFPTNFTALFLDNNQFYLFLMIQPYVLGLFFTALLLNRQFKLHIHHAIFGGLIYMGYLISRPLFKEGPIILLAIALFPAMVYFFLRFIERNRYLAFSLVGVFLALQFASGVSLFPQVLIWWILYIFVFHLFFADIKGFRAKVKAISICIFLMVLMAVGIFAVQFIPSYIFCREGSARLPGYYHINNYPILTPFASEPGNSLFCDLSESVVKSVSNSGRAIFAIMVSLAALFIMQMKTRILMSIRGKILLSFLATTSIFFVMPSVAGFLSQRFPFLVKALSTLSMFTFAYGIHIINFCLVVTMCFLMEYLCANGSSFKEIKTSPLRKVFSGIIIAAAIFYILLPVVLEFIQKFTGKSNFPAFLLYFTTGGLITALFVFISSCFIIGYFIFRPAGAMCRYACNILLILLGIMTVINCYNWNDKGRNIAEADYGMDSQEYKFYKSAKGKYFLPYDKPIAMDDNYNLLYGVHGICGLSAMPPKRLNRFLVYYYGGAEDRDYHLSGALHLYVHTILYDPPSMLTEYFPVDFTAITHDKKLPWTGFTKKVSGARYDIWVRDQPPNYVQFASSLKTVTTKDLIESFNKPFNEILIDNYDASEFNVTDQQIQRTSSLAPSYKDFIFLKNGGIRFKANIPEDTFVMVKEMFNEGWRVYVDKKPVDIFPAQHLFIGFKLPSGAHDIEMRFLPPGLFTGIILSILSICVLIFMIWFCYFNATERRRLC